MSLHQSRLYEKILVLNKPYGVLSKFSDEQGRPTLKSLVDVPDVYPVGRLDADSEGLLLLTNRKSLVEPLLAPGGKEKRYLACVEGVPSESALLSLRQGVVLKDGPTLGTEARQVEEPGWLWKREPPIRFRKTVPTSWIELALREGRNRQVRRMTAAVGLPTLRLIRTHFGPVGLGELPLGQWREATEHEVMELLAWEASFSRGHLSRRGRQDRPKRAPRPSGSQTASSSRRRRRSSGG